MTTPAKPPRFADADRLRQPLRVTLAPEEREALEAIAERRGATLSRTIGQLAREEQARQERRR